MMKKVIGQTVRDIKREVNKKVLKVHGIEQKVLDATSNEPWGPHGSLLADIAHASRNYHDYQIIMTVIWKRISDTGKNWRHVYKALTALEYLVANGSERVIDDIREHAYQISTLSDFQYIDSSGRDQGSNVRKKSQSLVALVNDKEKIIDVRHKAAANRDKFHNTSSSGGMYRLEGTGGYGENRNGYGYGRERDRGHRDDDENCKVWDTYSREADRYGREYKERYARDGYRDDVNCGRSVDEYHYGLRSRSSDRDGDHTVDHDGQYSFGDNSTRIDEQSPSGRRLDRKFSEQNLGAPPSYEEAISESRSPIHSERDGENTESASPRASSPPVSHETTVTESSPRASSSSQEVPGSAPATSASATSAPATSSPVLNQELETFNEFDPRCSGAAAPTASNRVEMDLLGGALSDSLTNAHANSATASSETDVGSSFAYSETQSTNQPFGDPFGDSPFKAIPPADYVSQNSHYTEHFQASLNQSTESPQSGAVDTETITNGDSCSATNYHAFSASNLHPASVNSQFLPQEQLAPQQDIDILADILPPLPSIASAAVSVPSGEYVVASQAAFTAPFSQPTQQSANYYEGFLSGAGPMVSLTASMGPPTPLVSHMTSQTPSGPATQLNEGNFVQHSSVAPVGSQVSFHIPTAPAIQNNHDVLGFSNQQAGQSTLMASQVALPSSTESLSIVPQPSTDKFETKSTVWADTLSRGLVNLNISGPKTNPLADIGIDFEAMNRKEKRMEKPVVAPVTSNVTMGKAMGSGSGMGRVAASSLRSPANPMVSSNMGMSMGMGMGGGPGQGMGMGMGIGGGQGMGMGAGMNMGGGPGQGMGMGMGVGPGQGMGMGMGVGPGQGMGMGMGMGSGYGGMNQQMGMNMGMGQGFHMQPQNGLPPSSTMSGNYNPMMGAGGYASQQPYGSGYR